VQPLPSAISRELATPIFQVPGEGHEAESLVDQEELTRETIRTLGFKNTNRKGHFDRYEVFD
jgi:hypothetical protein